MHSTAPIGTSKLVDAWKSSFIFKNMLQEMDNDIINVDIENVDTITVNKENNTNNNNNTTPVDISNKKILDTNSEWPADLRIPYAGSLYFHFKLTMERQIKLTMRDDVFIKSRIGKTLIFYLF
jgi:hypothetical protein